MQRSACRPTSSASARVRPLSRSTRWTSCGPSPGVTPVHVEVYGFIRSPVDDRGSSCRNTSRSCQVGTTFSMPTTEIEHLGQGQAHPAVALGLDDHERAGVGDREVGAGDGDLGAQELLPQVQPRRVGQLGRLVGQVSRGGPADVGHPAQEDLPDLRAVAVDRRDQDVARQVVAELHDELGEVGLPGGDALCLQGLVEADLLGGHRLDLDDLVDAVAAGDGRDDLAGLVGVARPVDCRRRRR